MWYSFFPFLSSFSFAIRRKRNKITSKPELKWNWNFRKWFVVVATKSNKNKNYSRFRNDCFTLCSRIVPQLWTADGDDVEYYFTFIFFFFFWFWYFFSNLFLSIHSFVRSIYICFYFLFSCHLLVFPLKVKPASNEIR